MDFEELAYYLYMDSQEKKRAAMEQQPHRKVNVRYFDDLESDEATTDEESEEEYQKSQNYSPHISSRRNATAFFMPGKI